MRATTTTTTKITSTTTSMTTSKTTTSKESTNQHQDSTTESTNQNLEDCQPDSFELKIQFKYHEIKDHYRDPNSSDSKLPVMTQQLSGLFSGTDKNALKTANEAMMMCILT